MTQWWKSRWGFREDDVTADEDTRSSPARRRPETVGVLVVFGVFSEESEVLSERPRKG